MRGGKMKNDINNTPFEEDDIFCGQETRTPGLDSVKVACGAFSCGLQSIHGG